MPPPDERKILTVSELTRKIQTLLEESFQAVWVEGEISQPTISTKGHLYFSLKDSDALIKCVMWRPARERLRFNLEHGLKVVCLGKISLYPPRGDCQLYVEHLEPKGIGALQLAFEQLKERLQKEGLFADERKRPLPAFPERVGIVTSPTGAAIEDMLKLLRGRVQVYLRPVRVQGDGAAEAVAQGIRELNAFEGLDLVIVGRGGGSLEDLWAFNEEVVARAVAASRIPVISAVGHEKDVTISDLAADLRAPTPTHAAEMVLARRKDCLDRLTAVLDDKAFTELEEWLGELTEGLEDSRDSLIESLQEPLLTAAHRIRILQSQLLSYSPQAVILHQAERLTRLHHSLESGMARGLEQLTSRFLGLAGRLNALSPLAVLARGYSITFDAKGRILKSAQAVSPGDLIKTKLLRGELTSRVEKGR
ncbi:MAG: exodeoxyribonuclease VII large subunit [Candidatus Omnitrophica bacterium]|nr:exodeoxyribonuclease VII large subunit [Candidatus Omnitrophota bacterium]